MIPIVRVCVFTFLIERINILEFVHSIGDDALSLVYHYYNIYCIDYNMCRPTTTTTCGARFGQCERINIRSTHPSCGVPPSQTHTLVNPVSISIVNIITLRKSVSFRFTLRNVILLSTFFFANTIWRFLQKSNSHGYGIRANVTTTSMK